MTVYTPPNALAVALAYARASAPEGVTVSTDMVTNAPELLPYVIVGISDPDNVANGPLSAASSFAVTIACYDDDIERAYATCCAVYSGFFRLWYAGHVTKHGYIANIAREGTQPHAVDSSTMEADSVARVDALLNVVARPTPTLTA